ncbi:alkaline ceramidase [Fodinicola acaciae]|uniref:alkaline ceramidase n=1 Tax=Fodinicola acaciae TaxID=2681555 RepID=UPI0013CFB015|nr:alkaline ceramidase [Fodinicola acaciae]
MNGIPVGVAVEDATPGWPVRMSGFAARSEPSTGVHDPISVRALAVGDTCVVAADVVGVDDRMSERIRAEAPFDSDRMVVTATHTHGGPAVMTGRLGAVDDKAADLVVRAGVRAAIRARQRQRPATLEFADAGALPIATDRRRGGHPDAARLRALRWTATSGETIATIASYPCHPVVLGADNRQLTADYPAALRAQLEAASGAPVLFLTGCAGDINTGHLATASYATAPTASRTFVEAERIGGELARAVADADWRRVPVTGRAKAAIERISLQLRTVDELSPAELAQRWRAELVDATPGQAAVLRTWIDWSGRPGAGRAGVWNGRVTAFGWGGVSLVFLPGEPFLTTGTAIEKASAAHGCIVAGYADDCPGYLPTADAYDSGGYEIDAAHRYYGMPAPFARGSAEIVAAVATRLLRRIEG